MCHKNSSQSSKLFPECISELKKKKQKRVIINVDYNDYNLRNVVICQIFRSLAQGQKLRVR